MAFFNFHLKDKVSENLPEASVFITGSNRWESFDSWPPDNTDDAEIYLLPEGGLSFFPPEIAASYDEYVSDPSKLVPYTGDITFKRTAEYMTADQRFASHRPDVMVYQSVPLKEDITMTGPLQVDLYVSTTGTRC